CTGVERAGPPQARPPERAARRYPMSAIVAGWKHWRLERDKYGDGIAWLWFDKAGQSTNTFSAHAMEELRDVPRALTAASPDQPKGLAIASAKDTGFIAGADVHEFTTIQSTD